MPAELFAVATRVSFVEMFDLGMNGLMVSGVPTPIHKIKLAKRHILPRKRQMRPK